jgi:isochorismate synthase
MRWIAEAVDARAADPLAWVAAAGAARDRFFWSRDGEAIAAHGALFAIESEGGARFADAARACERIAAARVGGDPGGPLFVGGFAFRDAPAPAGAWDAFPPLRFVLPERLVTARGGASRLVGFAALAPDVPERTARAALAARLAAECAELAGLPRLAREGGPPRYRVEADRPLESFRALTARARDAVAEGAFEKLVVARSVRIESAAPIDAGILLDLLRRAHPSCACYAVGRGAEWFAGASPERLLALHGRRVETIALAGSAPRGRTPEEDAELGRALRESKKEQEEHAVVVRAVARALAPLCTSLALPEAPGLRRIEGIQHLETPIAGMLKEPLHALALASHLHPTPAVAGAPRAAAVAWLDAHEALARGWYAGGVGWLDAAGGGELTVALRCARIEGGAAELYAGAGVVATSDPHAELLETRLKLRALLAPLLEL